MRLQGFFRGIVVHRRAIVGASLAVVLAAGAAATRVGVDYSVEQFFPRWGPERERYDAFKESFPREDAQVSWFAEAPDGDVARVAPAVAAVARAFRDAGLEGVSSAADAGPGPFEGIHWNTRRDVVAVHGWLPDGANTDRGRRSLERDLSARLRGIDAPGRTALTGAPVIRARVPALFEEDQARLLGGGLVLFLLVLLLAFRRPAPAFTTMAAVVPGYLCTLGVMGAAGVPISLLTGFTAIVVLVVGVCDAVHLVGAVLARRASGKTREDSVIEAFSDLALPCLYTSLTTAVGFATLALTRIGVVVEFGLLTAMGIALTWGFSMTLLPALLASIETPARERLRARRLEGLGARVVGFAQRAVGRWPRRTAWAFLALAALAGVSAAGLRPNSYLVDDLREGTEVLEDLRWVETSGFGVFQLNVFLRPDGRGEPTGPETAAWMAGVAHRLRDEPLVAGTLGLAEARLAPALAEQVLDRARGASQLIVLVRDGGSRAMLPLLDRLERILEESPPPVGTATVTGTVAMAQVFAADIIGSFGPSLALAVVLVFGAMALMFRSVRLGALALVPNVFPLFALAGTLRLMGVDLKPSTLLVFSIAFGIAVDDSIHLLSQLRLALDRGLRREAALRAAIAEAGPPILLTSALVAAGFGLLLLSRFQILATIGGVAATTTVAALAADLFLFPALLVLMPGAPIGPSRRGKPLDLRIPVPGGLSLRLVERPGAWMERGEMEALVRDLHAVADASSSGPPLRYGVMSGDREGLASAVVVLLRRRADDRPVAFNAGLLLDLGADGRRRLAYHSGLCMVAPTVRGRGLSAVLVSLPPVVAFLRGGLRPLWVTNVSQVPAAVGIFAASAEDVYPRPGATAPPSPGHLAVARALMARHRKRFGVGPDAVFDEAAFVIRNAYTGGSEPLRKGWEAVARHRDPAVNELCRERLDYRRGDDFLQVGRVSLAFALRLAGRFARCTARRASLRPERAPGPSGNTPPAGAPGRVRSPGRGLGEAWS